MGDFLEREQEALRRLPRVLTKRTWHVPMKRVGSRQPAGPGIHFGRGSGVVQYSVVKEQSVGALLRDGRVSNDWI